MMHVIKLTNGKTVILEERQNSLVVALGDEYESVDAYICQITVDGVLAYSNSCFSVVDLVNGLEEK